MECPYCGNALESGIFESRGCNYFRPENQSRPRWYSLLAMERVGCIMLPPSPYRLFPGDDMLKAYVCRQCRKIIIPYGMD